MRTDVRSAGKRPVHSCRGRIEWVGVAITTGSDMFTSARKISSGIIVFQTKRLYDYEAKMARDDVPQTDLACTY